MRKFILALLLSIAVSCPAMAQVVVGNATLGNTTIKNGTNVESATLTALKNIGGLTFYKDFTNGTVDAEFSAGSKTGTFTSTRSATAPATYIDSNGVIQKVTTSDVPLYDGGYYDDTGFHASDLGYHAYRSMANLFVSSVFDDNSGVSVNNVTYSATNRWATTLANNATVTNTISDDGVYLKSWNIEVTNQGDTAVADILTRNVNAVSITSGTVYTLSFMVKCDNSLTFPVKVTSSSDGLTARGLDTTITTVANTWIKVSLPFTASATDTVFARLYLGRKGTFNLKLNSLQIEAHPYATPFIPTTTAALTRAGEVLKYENLLNSTANEETIFVKFTPSSTFADDAQGRHLHSTLTKRRIIDKAPTIGVSKVTAFPNVDDTSGSKASTTTSPLTNKSYIVSATFKHSSPYVSIYLDGILEGTDTTPDYTNPAWGAFFNVGGASDGTVNQLDGNISAIVKFNRALSSTEVAQVTALLQ